MEVMKGISSALGMAPLIVEDSKEEVNATELVALPEEPTQTKQEQEAEEDFYIARTNMKSILTQGNDVLETMVRLASASETPRAYEVASKLIKDLSEANAGLLKLHEQRAQLAPAPPPEKIADPTVANVTNNVAFVGTTAELLTMILNQQKEQSIIEHNNK